MSQSMQNYYHKLALPHYALSDDRCYLYHRSSLYITEYVDILL